MDSPPMARSPISFSSQSSLSSEGEEEGYYDDGYFGYNNGGRQMSPTQESAVCLWEDCGREFDDLRALVAHVHDDHVGVHKSTYTCEWTTCPRRGLAQTSRFALVSHLRSHTGEKPFTCPLPECDKSFTRSDALAKHMRLQHDISPPLPGRGNRKRKRTDTGFITEVSYDGNNRTPQMQMIKNEEDDDDDYRISGRRRSTSPGGADDNSPYAGPSQHQHQHHSSGLGLRMSPVGGEGLSFGNGELPSHALKPIEDSDDDQLPSTLAPHYDPQTGLVHGRTVPRAKYLVMKAKHRYALQEHELLIEELNLVREEEAKLRKSKEEVFDRVLEVEIGDDADSLVGNVKMPPRERGNSIQVDSEVPQPVPQSRRRNSSSASYPIY